MKIGRCSGFTLIELMTVVVVIAILVVVGYPSYQDHIRKGKRAEGKAALLKAAQQLERYYTDRSTYQWAATGTVDVAPLVGLAAGAAVYSSENPADANASAYRITAQAATGACPVISCFELRATPNAPFVDPDCGFLSLMSTGVRSWGTTPANAARCRW